MSLFQKKENSESGKDISLLQLFDRLDLVSAVNGKEDLISSLSTDKVFWPSFLLFSIGSWLTGFIMGYGVLGFLGTEYIAEESRYTLLIAAIISFFGLFISYFVFVKVRGIFSRMLAISVALGSEYLIVFALAGEGASPLWAAIAAFVLLVLLAKPFADAAHQVGSSAIFCVMLVYVLSSYFNHYAMPLIVLCTFPIALLALFYPMKGLDLRPLGVVFLLPPLLFSLYCFKTTEFSFISDVYGRIIYAGVFSFLLYLLWPALSFNGKRFMCCVFIPILLFGLFTSLGIAASFIIMFIAYMISSRLVLSVGFIANILFTVVFYLNLDLSPVGLALILFGTGLLIVLISLWVLHLVREGNKC